MSKELLSLNADERVTAVKAAYTENKGLPLSNETATEKIPYAKKQVEDALVLDLKTEMLKLDALRKGDDRNVPIDISLAQYAQERWGIAPTDKGTADNFYMSLGIDSSNTTLERLTSFADINENYRWIVPEVLLEAVRLGLRTNPIYPDLIRQEISVTQQKITMPSILESDVTLKYTKEFESIGTGTVGFGSKDVKIEKMATGIRLSDEVVRFSTINMLSIFLEDVGLKVGRGLDVLAIKTLMLGDQKDTSDQIGSVGVTTSGTLTYKDLLRVWLRMSQLGTQPNAMVMNENPAMDLFMLDEFRLPNPQGFSGTNPSNLNAPALNIRTALPQTQDVYVHGAVTDDNHILMVNAAQAMLKLNASAMRVEQDRNVGRQFDSYYVSMITGFATLKRDARILLNIGSGTTTFPSYMDVASYQTDAEIK